MGVCECCGMSTENPRFCSRRCSAVVTNSESPRRKKIPRLCETCGVDISNLGSGRHRFCDEHNPQKVDWSQVTIAQMQTKRRYQKHSRLRELARRAWRDSGRSNECRECGYDKHVEICHIKPLSEFGEDTTVAEVNALENLVPLCPNHHWELDNGILKL